MFMPESYIRPTLSHSAMGLKNQLCGHQLFQESSPLSSPSHPTHQCQHSSSSALSGSNGSNGSVWMGAYRTVRGSCRGKGGSGFRARVQGNPFGGYLERGGGVKRGMRGLGGFLGGWYGGFLGGWNGGFLGGKHGGLLQGGIVGSGGGAGRGGAL